MNSEKEELIKYRTSRAEECLEEAKILNDTKHYNASVNRLYYSCFYAVTALLIKNDLSSSKHSGIRSLFNKNFVKNDKISKEMANLYNDLYEYRQESDYKDFFSIKEDKISSWIPMVNKFIDEIKNLL